MTIAVKRRHLAIRRWLPGQSDRHFNVGCGAISLPGRRQLGRTVNLEIERKPFPDLVLYDGSTFPFQDCSFDAVLCLDVLEHVEDDLGLLRQIAGVLRPEGVLLLTTPAIEHDFKEVSLPLGKASRKWSQAESQWGHVRTGYEL